MEFSNFDINELLQSETQVAVFKRGQKARFYYPLDSLEDIHSMALKEFNRMISLNSKRYRVTEDYVLEKIEKIKQELILRLPSQISEVVIMQFESEMIETMAYFNMLAEEKDFDKQLELTNLDGKKMIAWVFNTLILIGVCYPPIKLNIQSDEFLNMRKAIIAIPQEQSLAPMVYNATNLELEMESYAKLFLFLKNDPFIRSSFIDKLDSVIIEPRLSHEEIRNYQMQLALAEKAGDAFGDIGELKAQWENYAMQDIYRYTRDKSKEIWESETVDEVLSIVDEKNDQLFVQNLLSQPEFMAEYPYIIQVVDKG